MKPAPQLFNLKDKVAELWRKACIKEGIGTDAKFVVFSKKHTALNNATAKFLVQKAIYQTFLDAENLIHADSSVGNARFGLALLTLQSAYKFAAKGAF